MAFVIADRVRETSTSTGTGNFTLGGAVTGYRTFASVLASADTTYYTIADQGGANWEVGIGTFTSPSTLARTTVLSSSNAGSLVTFTAGTKDVFISLPAGRTVQSVDGGSTGLTPATASYGAVSLAGTLNAVNGGTGQTSYAVGDLLYASTTTALSKLADVATGNALISGGVGVAPSYGKIGLTTHVSGTLPVQNGGTNITAYGVGDILYASSAGVLSRLSDVATGNALISGGVGVAPSYGKIGLTTHVSGTLPVANGGTGTATQFTTGSVVFAGASGVYSQNNAQFFWDNTNNRLGVGITTPTAKAHISSDRTTTATSQTWDTYNGATFENSITLSYTGSVTNFGNFQSNPLAFITNNTERMRLDTSGNLLFNSGYGSVATAYGCRAWVNFNGTTASPSTMRGNGNVSSVTKFGTGDFQVNFSTALVDANYSTVVTGDAPVNGQHCNGYVYYIRNVYSTTAVGVGWFNATNSGTRADPTYGLVAVFR